jgi:anti-sigma B factor antagonist
MDTAIGVFSSRERAEQALKSLFDHDIPRHRIVYLTRFESESNATRLQLGEIASRLDTSSFAMDGVGPVFALGFGSDHTPGSAGAAAPAAVGASEDSGLFRSMLKDGCSVIVVRTASPNVAAVACEILDKFGLHMKKSPAPRNSVIFRQLPGAVVAELTGKIALTDGTQLLRESIHNFLAHGHNYILLDLERVQFIDSAGLGELVRSQATVRSRGGQLKLLRPSAGVRNLLQMTKLDQVFEILPDEFTALQALHASA